MSEQRSFAVPLGANGSRADKFIADASGLSRAYVQRLIADGYLMPFSKWNPSSPLPEPPEILRESERCADEVLKRFFPDLAPA